MPIMLQTVHDSQVLIIRTPEECLLCIEQAMKEWAEFLAGLERPLRLPVELAPGEKWRTEVIL